MKPSVSVIIPALNEEGSIEATVNHVLDAIGDRFSGYELLVFDDGSSDQTGNIAERLAASNPHIRVIHNGTNMGFGYNYRKGVGLARMDYIVMFPGDNEIDETSIKHIIDLVGSAEIIIPYTVNREVRPLSRRIVSRAFVIFINLFTGLRLHYYNGPVVYRRELVQSIRIRTNGFAYQADALARLISSGHSYVEVGMLIRKREQGRSKAVSVKNIVSVLRTVLNLAWELRMRPRKENSALSQGR